MTGLEAVVKRKIPSLYLRFVLMLSSYLLVCLQAHIFQEIPQPKLCMPSLFPPPKCMLKAS